MLVRNLRTMKVIYQINVFESSGSSSPSLSQIKDLSVYIGVMRSQHVLTIDS